MKTRRRQNISLTLAAALALLLLAGCRDRDPTLRLSDITPGERLYIERIIALERAKSMRLIYPRIGDALFDSLASAWGDSVKPETLAGLSQDPTRAVALGELLLRVVSAEQDSLSWAPGSSRLHLPLPDPDRPGRLRPADPADKTAAAPKP